MAEQVPALEIEKKRLKDKEAISSETINKLKKDIEKQKEEQKKLMDELEEAK